MKSVYNILPVTGLEQANLYADLLLSYKNFAFVLRDVIRDAYIVMDLYAQVMYNTPKDTAQKVKSAFGEAAGGSRNILTRDTGIVW